MSDADDKVQAYTYGPYTDYNMLKNKPMINNKEIEGNMSMEDLGQSDQFDMASALVDGLYGIIGSANKS